jgi:hypothetical protein
MPANRAITQLALGIVPSAAESKKNFVSLETYFHSI